MESGNRKRPIIQPGNDKTNKRNGNKVTSMRIELSEEYSRRRRRRGERDNRKRNEENTRKRMMGEGKRSGGRKRKRNLEYRKDTKTPTIKNIRYPTSETRNKKGMVSGRKLKKGK